MEVSDFQVGVAGCWLEHPIMNGAGTCRSFDGPEGIKELARSATSAIMVGSITVDPRPGNSGEVYYQDGFCSLNSMGLPNLGRDFYKKNLPDMAKIAYDAHKPLFVSIAGSKPSEYAELAQLVSPIANVIELNLSCPNVWENNQQESIICFNPDLVEETLFCVEKAIGNYEKIAVKLSPFSDPFALIKTAEIIAKHEIVKIVTTSNTFPNAFIFIHSGKREPAIDNELGGLGGPALKPIALGQVRQLSKILPERIDIIGVGGIRTGRDVVDFLKAGATAVQITSLFLEMGVRVFGDLLDELLDEYEMLGEYERKE